MSDSNSLAKQATAAFRRGDASEAANALVLLVSALSSRANEQMLPRITALQSLARLLASASGDEHTKALQTAYAVLSDDMGTAALQVREGLLSPAQQHGSPRAPWPSSACVQPQADLAHAGGGSDAHARLARYNAGAIALCCGWWAQAACELEPLVGDGQPQDATSLRAAYALVQVYAQALCGLASGAVGGCEQSKLQYAAKAAAMRQWLEQATAAWCARVQDPAGNATDLAVLSSTDAVQRLATLRQHVLSAWLNYSAGDARAALHCAEDGRRLFRVCWTSAHKDHLDVSASLMSSRHGVIQACQLQLLALQVSAAAAARAGKLDDAADTLLAAQRIAAKLPESVRPPQWQFSNNVAVLALRNGKPVLASTVLRNALADIAAAEQRAPPATGLTAAEPAGLSLGVDGWAPVACDTKLSVQQNAGLAYLQVREPGPALACFHAALAQHSHHARLWLRAGEAALLGCVHALERRASSGCSLKRQQQQQPADATCDSSPVSWLGDGIVSGIVGSAERQRAVMHCGSLNSLPLDADAALLADSHQAAAVLHAGGPSMSLQYATQCFRNALLLMPTAAQIQAQHRPDSSPAHTQSLMAALETSMALYCKLTFTALTAQHYSAAAHSLVQLSAVRAAAVAIAGAQRAHAQLHSWMWLSSLYSVEVAVQLGDVAQAVTHLNSLMLPRDMQRESDAPAQANGAQVKQQAARMVAMTIVALTHGERATAVRCCAQALHTSPSSALVRKLAVYMQLLGGDSMAAGRMLATGELPAEHWLAMQKSSDS